MTYRNIEHVISTSPISPSWLNCSPPRNQRPERGIWERALRDTYRTPGRVRSVCQCEEHGTSSHLRIRYCSHLPTKGWVGGGNRTGYTIDVVFLIASSYVVTIYVQRDQHVLTRFWIILSGWWVGYLYSSYWNSKLLYEQKSLNFWSADKRSSPDQDYLLGNSTVLLGREWISIASRRNASQCQAKIRIR